MAIKFRYYSRHWHRDNYVIIRCTSSGWHLEMNLVRGDCDRGARPILYEILEVDKVDYPHDLPGYMEHLWECIKRDSLQETIIQKHLDLLSDWMENVERNKPRLEIWRDYKPSVETGGR